MDAHPCKNEADAPLRCNRDGESLTIGAIKMQIRRVSKKVLGYEIGPHAQRHFSETRDGNSGMPLNALMGKYRQKTPRVVMRYYHEREKAAQNYELLKRGITSPEEVEDIVPETFGVASADRKEIEHLRQELNTHRKLWDTLVEVLNQAAVEGKIENLMSAMRTIQAASLVQQSYTTERSSTE